MRAITTMTRDWNRSGKYLKDRIDIKFAAVRMRKERLVNVKRIAWPKPTGLSTWVNSGRSLTFRVVTIMSRGADHADNDHGDLQGEDGRGGARLRPEQLRDDEAEQHAEQAEERRRHLEAAFRSASDSVISGSSAE